MKNESLNLSPQDAKVLEALFKSNGYTLITDTDESGADDSQKSPGRILMNAFREKDSALFLQTARDICSGSMKESVWL